ncbi:MAG: FkbM family methyltransferase [Ignavibacteriales bacterium]
MGNLKLKIDEIELTVNPFQFTEIWNFIASGKWEPESFKVFKRFIKESDVVIDIGSWAGPLTIYAAHLSSFVHSIDPDPVIFNQLLHNVSLNPQVSDKIKCHNLAIWKDSSTQILFSRNVFGDSASSLIQRTRDKNNQAAIQTISFEKFIEKEKIEKVDFIKVDIEGGEFFILPSLTDKLEQLGLPILFISFHTEYLNEYFFQKTFRIKLLSKILFKIFKGFRINIFSKRITQIISNSIEPLKAYKYIYEPDKCLITSEALIMKLGKYDTLSVLFSSEPW